MGFEKLFQRFFKKLVILLQITLGEEDVTMFVYGYTGLDKTATVKCTDIDLSL